MSNLKQEALRKDIPIISDEGLSFLLNYIEEHNCKSILELGTAVGYSAIEMAKLDSDIHIDTIERNPDMYKQAIDNISKADLKDQINAFFMPIEEYKTDKKYDLIFVDAAKAQYEKYLNQFLDNLNKDGAFIFDNTIFHGLIYEVDSIESKNLKNLVKKIIKFRENVHNDSRFDIILFDNIGDGILLLTRRDSET